MPRKKAEVEEETSLREYIEESTYDYGSAIVLYGLDRYYDALDGTDNTLEPERQMSREQVGYLNLLSSGLTNDEACEVLKIDVMLPMLWRAKEGKNSVYGCAMEGIDEKRANDVEDGIRAEALRDPKNSILKMFYVKGWKDRYKDNAPPVTAVQTNVHVTLIDNNGEKIPYIVDVTPQEQIGSPYAQDD